MHVIIVFMGLDNRKKTKINQRNNKRKMINETPEKVRERISKTVDEAMQGINVNPQMRHILIQICFEMYKSGFVDGCRGCKLSCESMKDIFMDKNSKVIVDNFRD